MDWGSWQATVYGVAKSRTRLGHFTSLVHCTGSTALCIQRRAKHEQVRVVKKSFFLDPSIFQLILKASFSTVNFSRLLYFYLNKASRLMSYITEAGRWGAGSLKHDAHTKIEQRREKTAGEKDVKFLLKCISCLWGLESNRHIRNYFEKNGAKLWEQLQNSEKNPDNKAK